METIGAVLTRVEPGVVEVALPYRADLTQQHGFLHAGIVATILDSACGYAAATMLQRLLANLLDNAARHAAPPILLSLTIDRGARQAALTVERHAGTLEIGAVDGGGTRVTVHLPLN